MRPTVAAFLLIAALALVPTSEAHSVARAASKSCAVSHLVPIADLQVVGASCAGARDLTRTWLKRTYGGGCSSFYCRIAKWTCRGRQGLYFYVRCTKPGHHRVSFKAVGDD